MDKIIFRESMDTEAANVETVLVHSKNIRVELRQNPTEDDVGVRFSGEVVTNGMPRVELEVDGSVCNVRAEISGGSWMGKARLEIMLPGKVLSQLTVESGFGDITLNGMPKAKQLSLHTNNQRIISQ